MRHSPLLFRIATKHTAPAVRSAIKCLFHFDDGLFVILIMICAMLFPISVSSAFDGIYRKGRSESGKPAISSTHRRDRLPADASALMRRSTTTIVGGARVAALTYLDGTGRALPQTFFAGRPIGRPTGRPTRRRKQDTAASVRPAMRAQRAPRESRGALRRNVRGPRFVFVSSAEAVKASGHRARARSPANVLPPRTRRAARVAPCGRHDNPRVSTGKFL